MFGDSLSGRSGVGDQCHSPTLHTCQLLVIRRAVLHESSRGRERVPLVPLELIIVIRIVTLSATARWRICCRKVLIQLAHVLLYIQATPRRSKSQKSHTETPRLHSLDLDMIAKESRQGLFSHIKSLMTIILKLAASTHIITPFLRCA